MSQNDLNVNSQCIAQDICQDPIKEEKLNEYKDKNEEKNNLEEKLLNLIDIIIEFYLYEKKISIEYRNINSNFKGSGFFIDKKLIDSWKEGTNYGIIKEQYLENNLIPKSKKKNAILNYFLDSKFDINNVVRIESLNSLSEEEFKRFSRKNSFVVINSSLYELMIGKKEDEIKGIKYCIHNNEISITFKDAHLKFNINYDNIIYSYLDYNLFFIINLFFNEEKLKSNIRTKNEIEYNTFVLVDKSFYSQLKKALNYNSLYNYLYNFLIKGKNINFNIERIYNETIFKIIQNLPEDVINTIPINIEKEKFYLQWNIIKEKEIDNKKFKYINNAQIISIPLSNVLSQTIIDTNKIIIYSRFYYIKNKILAIFKDRVTKLYYFQIGHIDDQNIFITEYIIDINFKKNQINKLDEFDHYFNPVDANNICHCLEAYSIRKCFLFNNKKSFLIKLNDNIDSFSLLNNSDINYGKKFENKDTYKIIAYLNVILRLYLLGESFKSTINSGNNITSEFYMLNEDWIKEFKSTFFYEEIMTEEVKNIIKDDNIRQINDKIINIIPENIINKLNNLSKINVCNSLKDPKYLEIKYIQDEYEYNNNILFTSNYALINKDIKNFLKDSNKKPSSKKNGKSNPQKLEAIVCIFTDNKMIITLKPKEKEKEKTINIGHYDNYLFNTEKIIIAKKTIIEQIFNIFKKEGYNSYIKYLLFNKDIFEIKGANIKVIKDFNNNNYKMNLTINKSLLAFICLSIFNHNIIEQTKILNNNQFEEVCLINVDLLGKGGYKKVNEIINKNIKNKYIFNKDYKDILFTDFILSLEEENIISLGKINRALNQTKINIENYFANFQYLITPKKNSIFFYNNFFPINKKIFELFFNNKKENIKPQFIKFFSGNTKNIALIENDKQSTILLGSILNDENIFKLEFIIDFINKIYLDENFDYICKEPNEFIIKHYGNNNNINDYISKIYNEDNLLIGYIYKYNEHLLNKSNLLNNDIENKIEVKERNIPNNNILNDNNIKNDIQSNNDTNVKYNIIVNNNYINNDIPNKIYSNNNAINNISINGEIKRNNDVLNINESKIFYNNIINNNIINSNLLNANCQNIQNIKKMKDNSNKNKNNNIVNNSKNINYLNQNDEITLLANQINDLKNQLIDEKEKNKKLSEKIKIVKNNLKEEENKNINMEKTSNNLKTQLDKELKKNKDLENKLKSQLENSNLVQYGSKDSLLNALLNKDKEIEELKIKLSRYPFELNEGEILICINFKSLDLKLECYSIICKDSELFCDIEKKLYENNREYCETENYFTVNGIRINKFQSLKENRIKNNDIIIINKLDI